MLRSYHKVLSLILVASFSAVCCFADIIQADSPVRIIVNPNTTKIEAGSEAIALTAKATGKNLQYNWTLVGPGELSGTDMPAVFYTPPARISGKSSQAIVTVRVTDEAGQQSTESVTFNIVPGAKTETQPAGATTEKEGMSRTTKIALGVGAAAALGGGIALLAGGDDDDDDDPFTGTFRGNDRSGTSNQGNPYTFYYVFTLKQDGTVLTGTLTYNATLLNCCTNVITVPITGNVSGNSANISTGAGEASCQCSWTTWYTSLNAGSAHMTLVNGNTLVFDGGAEYYRTKMMELDPESDYGLPASPLEGSFTRQ